MLKSLIQPHSKPVQPVRQKLVIELDGPDISDSRSEPVGRPVSVSGSKTSFQILFGRTAK